MDENQLYNSLSFLWTSGIALVVVGLCAGWLLGGMFARRQEAVAPRTAADFSKRSAPEAPSTRIDLLAVVNREIRTPLNGVIGYTDLLLDTPLLSDQREFATNVRQSAEVLVAMLNDISDYTRLQNGKLELAATAFSFTDLLSEVLDLLAPQANEKGLEFAHDIVPHERLQVLADPARTRQVLLNLISNAIKFTAEGHVVVRVELKPGSPGHLRCLICDTGCGVTPESQTDLFTRPGGTDTGIVRRFGGPGIGIALSRRLVELMGGEIGVNSQPGKGSEFWFQLPLAPADPVPDVPAAKSSATETSPRVLVVEPAPIARKMVASHFTAAGFAVEALGSGEEALARLRELASEGTPLHSVIFSETLPEMTGRAFAQAVRTDPALRSIGLVCLRRQGVRLTSNNATSHGVVEVVKPVLRAAQLLHAVRTAATMVAANEFSETTAAVSDQAGPSAKAPEMVSGASVGIALLAEDNELHQRVLSEMLRRVGWACKIAENGAEAVRLAGLSRYDIILMDCHMPELNGFDATRRIRQGETASKATGTPIVAVTADALAESRDRCLAAGMDDCLTKPFRRVELEDMLKRWAPRIRTAAQPAA